MDEQKIWEEYKKLKIAVNTIPKYENPHQFATQFKRCSVLEEGGVYYTSSTREQKEK